MPPANNPLWIEWRTSPARAIIMADLERGGILHRRDHISAEEIFDFYKRLPQFENVVWKQVSERLHRSMQEEQYWSLVYSY